ncbi:unnamed protein product [Lepidochelys kempii]
MGRFGGTDSPGSSGRSREHSHKRHTASIPEQGYMAPTTTPTKPQPQQGGIWPWEAARQAGGTGSQLQTPAEAVGLRCAAQGTAPVEAMGLRSEAPAAAPAKPRTLPGREACCYCHVAEQTKHKQTLNKGQDRQ